MSKNRGVLLLLLLLAAILLAIGLIAPIITFKKFILIENTFSIISACWNLLNQGQLFLFIIITAFSIIFPIIKLTVLAKILISHSYVKQNTKILLDWIHHLGKWSMLDVFVVAILVVVVKLGAIGSVEKHIGLYAYAASAILMMLLTDNVTKVHKHEQK